MIKSRIMMSVGHVTRMLEREVHTGFWWGKKPLGRPRRRWQDNIKMDFKDIKWGPRTSLMELIWLRTGILGGLI
jgi:hypothetical protein